MKFDRVKDLEKELNRIESTLPAWADAKSKVVFSLLKGKSVLDIGCGIGTFSRRLSEKGFMVVGMDVSEKCLNKAREACPDKIRFIHDDICRPRKLHRLKFDSVLALDVLEHIRDDGKAIRNIRSLLKPKGTLVLTAPAFNFLFSKYDLMVGHEKRYSAHQLRKLLEENGFNVERLFYWNLLGFFGWLILLKILRRLPSAFDTKTNTIYKYWFKIENKIKPPLGITIFIKATKT